MTSFASRLRDERVRVGLSALVLAAAAQVSEAELVAFETGLASPDALHLRGMAGFGIDVLYVVTGERLMPKKNKRWSNRKNLLVEQYARASESGKRLIDSVARVAASRATSGTSQ